MKAMQLVTLSQIDVHSKPLQMVEMAPPEPGTNELLIKVKACGVCHTELDQIEGRIQPSRLPVTPGHQAAGVVVACGAGVTRHIPGDRVGVGWIGGSCGQCNYCLSGYENLCADFKATGRDMDGGYGEYMLAHEQMAHTIPESVSLIHAAPFLCAGAIGYRSLQLTQLQDGQPIGLTGFGGSAHLVLQMLRYRFPGSPVYVFARQKEEQQFALELGAHWSGNTTDRAPELMQAIIDTTPAWLPVVSALEQLAPGGRLVINAIRKEAFDKEQLLQLDYPRHLWQEKELKSVANVTRRDICEFLQLAAELNLKPEVESFSLEQANQALIELKHKKVRGAKVLVF